MFKINLKILKFGKQLIYITSLNICLLIFSIFFKNDTEYIIKLFNILTFKFISKLTENVESEMILSLYNFYTFLILITFFIAVILGLLYETKYNISTSIRIQELISISFTLTLHHINILIFYAYYGNIKSLFNSNFYIITIFIDLAVLLYSYYIFINSYDIQEDDNSNYEYMNPS